MIPKYVQVKNITDKPQRMRDQRIPGGVMDFAPGETKPVPSIAWGIQWRQSWAVNVDRVLPEAAKEVEEVELTMKDIRAKLGEKGIKVPVGTTKADALAMLEESEQSE